MPDPAGIAWRPVLGLVTCVVRGAVSVRFFYL